LTVHDRYHTITAAGINPLPVQRPIPIIVGGHSDVAMRRAARIGDGWFPFINSAKAVPVARKFEAAVAAAGRKREDVALHNNVLLGATMGDGKVKSLDEIAADAALFREAGLDGVSLSTMDRGLATAGEHIAFLRRLAQALDL
jgi:alkanesulfonate monooxygenase SsuD/methylene tetrahydromethanopterin reductase-like flavin-dependent oxidoreductase (luciferase family)